MAALSAIQPNLSYSQGLALVCENDSKERMSKVSHLVTAKAFRWPHSFTPDPSPVYVLRFVRRLMLQ